MSETQLTGIAEVVLAGTEILREDAFCLMRSVEIMWQTNVSSATEANSIRELASCDELNFIKGIMKAMFHNQIIY